MEGKRFAVGLVAGLLVAVGVVTAAGSLGTAPASVLFGPTSGSAAVTTAGVATTTATAAMSATSGSAAFPNATSSGSQTYTTSVTTSTKASVTSASTPGANGQNADNAAKPPTFSSQLVDISRQPPLSNALILVPVLVAFLLGAVLYRASIRDRTSSEEE